MSIVIRGKSRRGTGGGWKRPWSHPETDPDLEDPTAPSAPRSMRPPLRARWWSDRSWNAVIESWDRIRHEFKSHLPPGVSFPNDLTCPGTGGVASGGFPADPACQPTLTERSEGLALFPPSPGEDPDA